MQVGTRTMARAVPNQTNGVFDLESRVWNLHNGTFMIFHNHFYDLQQLTADF